MRRKKLSDQVQKKVNKKTEKKIEDKENQQIISTGSTLLDLAISGGRFEEGGIPTGILVEIFGPSGSGKTVLLCQIAGNMQKLGSEIMFHDPEARLNKQFAKMFGLDSDIITYTTPDTIPQVFKSVREWVSDDQENGNYGVFADSLTALSTEMELENSDKMGMRRAKEFSEELRKTCRIITNKNMLMVCSNQIRQNLDAGPYGQKYKSPGGEALGFYASLRLRCSSPQKQKVKKSIRGKEHERTIGVKTDIEVYKSSIWKPFHTAEVYILYDYGIDDIRGNLRYLKTSSKDTVYKLNDTTLGKSLEDAIRTVEDDHLEEELKKATIDLWKEIEEKFIDPRKPREW